MSDLKSHIATVASGKTLSFAEARAAFDIIMSGEATPSQIGAFLMALRVRGETIDEISGAVATMREKMLKVDAPDDAIVELNIPTGIPLIYELDSDLKPIRSYYLGDPEAARKAAEAVAKQGSRV